MNTTRNKVYSQYKNCENSFSVLSYNILADCYAECFRSDYFFVEDVDILKEDGLLSKRHLLFMKEIQYFDPDIILLQEVEDWYSSFLSSEFERISYNYLFCQKQGKKDGSVVAYRNERFELFDSQRVHIRDEIRQICDNDDISIESIQHLLQPQVGLFATLKDKLNQKFVICGTTHIIFSLVNPALQCLQSAILCKKLFEIQLENSRKLKIDEIPVIFAGDFNSEPDRINIRLLKNGTLTSSELKTLETLSFVLRKGKAVEQTLSKVNDVCKYFSKYLCHDLNFSSAFFDTIGSEPHVTSSIGAKYSGCLDYIFYTQSSLKVKSVVDIDSDIAHTYQQIGGPTGQFASDHLPLIAEFSF